jgi:hypothetical protein
MPMLFRIRLCEELMIGDGEFVLSTICEVDPTMDLEPEVEHLVLTQDELDQLYRAVEPHQAIDDGPETIRRLETQVADLRRELDRERSRATDIAGVAIPAGTMVYFHPKADRSLGTSPPRSFAELRREADDLRADRDRIRSRMQAEREAFKEDDRKLRAILGIRVGEDIMAAVRSLVRSDDDSADEEEEDVVPLFDADHMHVLLNETGANFAPGSSLFAKVRAVCDEIKDRNTLFASTAELLKSKGVAWGPGVFRNVIEEWDDLRRFRDAVGQMVGADNPRSIPSVMAALSRMVVAPQLEAKARIDGIDPTRIPAGYAWTFKRVKPEEKDPFRCTVHAPDYAGAVKALRDHGRAGTWIHDPVYPEEQGRREACTTEIGPIVIP